MISSNITLEYLSTYKNKDNVKIVCPVCNINFTRTKQYLKGSISRNRSIFCSPSCSSISKNLKYGYGLKIVICMKCNKKFTKSISAINKTKNNFCSHSCSASYSNTHKKTGYRRSKLEIYLENQIRLIYPNLILLCNSKEIIKSELDFYFPSLNLAIEINGIFHYKPIYGYDRLTKIENNDKRKIIGCQEQDIKLIIIDTSHILKLTKNNTFEIMSLIHIVLNENKPPAWN